MYLDHFGLSEAPFRITPHTDFFFDGANRGATLDALIYAVTHDEGIVKVSGEVGSGKTMLCRVLMERLPETVTIIYLANPSLSRDDILYAISDELRLDVPDSARNSVVMRSLQEHLIKSFSEGRQVVVLIDEAHAMPVETLEEIRLLSNLETNRNKLLQLVLFGQPELNDILARPDMRQLKERITHNFGLEPLVRDDINHYLDFRMRAAGYRGPSVFSAPALKMIEQSSLGLTRRINILADKSLLAAFSAGSHQIGPKEIKAAIRDCEFSEATYGGKPTNRARTLWIAALLGMVALAGAIWLLAASRNDIGAPATVTVAPSVPAGDAAPTVVISAPAPQAATPLATSTTTAGAPSTPTPATLPAAATPPPAPYAATGTLPPLTAAPAEPVPGLKRDAPGWRNCRTTAGSFSCSRRTPTGMAKLKPCCANCRPAGPTWTRSTCITPSSAASPVTESRMESIQLGNRPQPQYAAYPNRCGRANPIRARSCVFAKSVVKVRIEAAQSIKSLSCIVNIMCYAKFCR
jgi:type II secretory pathway predicted ATPase ExeA